MSAANTLNRPAVKDGLGAAPRRRESQIEG